MLVSAVDYLPKYRLACFTVQVFITNSSRNMFYAQILQHGFVDTWIVEAARSAIFGDKYVVK